MTQTIEFPYLAGQTLAVSIFPSDSSTATATSSASEFIPGVYRVDFSVAAGTYRFTASISGTVVYTDLIDLLSITNIYRGYSESLDIDQVIIQSGENENYSCDPATVDPDVSTECSDWTLSLAPMLRVFIGDHEESAKYTNSRLCEILLAAAFYVSGDVCTCSSFKTLSVDYEEKTISIDPLSNPVLANLIVLKAACLIDQSSLRLKAVREGISAACGPARISISASSSFKALIESGPCKAYDTLKYQCCVLNSIAEAKYCRLIVSAFVKDYGC